MTKMDSFALRGIVFLCCVAFGSCLSYVEMKDEHLLQQATHVFVGTVTQVVPQWKTTYAYDGTPSWSITQVHYAVEPERIIKGPRLPKEVTIEVDGGTDAALPEEAKNNLDRVSISMIYGSPTFTVGERVLLFCLLGRGHNSTTGVMKLQIAQIFLGAFHSANSDSDDTGFALRSLDVGPEHFLQFDTSGKIIKPDTSDKLAVRDLEKFADWLEDITGGYSR